MGCKAARPTIVRIHRKLGLAGRIPDSLCMGIRGMAFIPPRVWLGGYDDGGRNEHVCTFSCDIAAHLSTL